MKNYTVTILCPNCHHDIRLHDHNGCMVMKPNTVTETIGVDQGQYCLCTKSYYRRDRKK